MEDFITIADPRNQPLLVPLPLVCYLTSLLLLQMHSPFPWNIHETLHLFLYIWFWYAYSSRASIKKSLSSLPSQGRATNCIHITLSHTTCEIIYQKFVKLYKCWSTHSTSPQKDSKKDPFFFSGEVIIFIYSSKFFIIFFKWRAATCIHFLACCIAIY